MENGSVFNILDTREINTLIGLKNKIKMLDTDTKVFVGDLQRIVFTIRNKTAQHLACLLIS